MKTLLQSYKIQAITLIFLWIVSMILSAEFILSVAMIALIALALFQLKIEGPRIQITLRHTLKTNFQNYRQYRPWLWVSVPFFLVLISACWSSDLEYTLERLRIKLPFLVLPFAFVSIPHLKKRECYAILYFLVVVMFIASLWSLGQFLGNAEEVIDQIGKGKPFPTPSNHIRFSLVLGLSIIGGATLFLEKFHLQSPSERYFIAGMTCFLLIFLHLISVRSGLLTFYFTVFILSIQFILSTKRYAAGIAFLGALFCLPILAYFTLPSLKKKIDYTRWDYQQFQQGIGGQYSDSERITSLNIGLKVAKEHPIMGVGAGDLKAAVYQVYDSELSGNYSPRMPHNQFISIYAGTGLIGLIFFITAFFIPLFYKKNYQNPLFLALHAVVFISFMMENTIENNFGLSLYLLFLLMGLNHLSLGSQVEISIEKS